MEQPLESLTESIEKDKWNAEFELQNLKKINSLSSLEGKKILITAGPTYERLDDVRFIGNFSSGRMGFALAAEAAKAGAEVTLIAGPVSLETPDGVKRIDVESAAQMFKEATQLFPHCDIAILAAAVADYRPKTKFEGKIKKLATGTELSVELESTEDILATLGKSKSDKQLLIGFALESANEIENARKKLFSKNCDMIVLNYANREGSGFSGEDNTIVILGKDGYLKEYPRMSKKECARVILNIASDKLIT